MGEDSSTKKLLKRARLAESKREFSAGGVVFKRIDGKTFWLVCKSAPSSMYPEPVWRLPKGWIDDRDGGLTPGPISSGEIKASEGELREGALREVKEEGGVEARIIDKVETLKLFLTTTRGKILKFIKFYLMEWIKDTEGFGLETSKTVWLPYEEARKRLSYSSEKKVLDKAKEILERGTQGSLI